MNKENDELVYKYYSDESKYAFDNLKNEYISFSSLGMLNDPLEGYGAYMSHDISHDELIEHDDVNKSEEQKEAEREALENVGNMFSEWDKNYESFACRVFCASNEYDNCLLWSYYANSHKGFCVGYRKKDIEKITNSEMFDVQYNKRVYFVDTKNIVKNDQYNFDELKKSLSVKSELWRHEDECRAIYRLNKDEIATYQPSRYYDDIVESSEMIFATFNFREKMCSKKYILKACRPAVIYLGMKMLDEEKIKNLREIAYYKNIDIFKMKQKSKSYGIEKGSSLNPQRV
ncbi:MAG: DUF2971 domain-containing protein [Clostridiales bacterium]|nr:DUF2971 domain-containing protein [Clostridiales bacterium]